MADFPTTPKYGYSFGKEIEFRTLVSNFENGAEQRRAKWSQGKRKFTVTYNAVSPANMTILYDFYVARKGSFESFNFTDPITSTVYAVRFVDNKMSFEEFTYNVRRTGLQMIQVL